MISSTKQHSDFAIVPEDSPDRCQAVNSQGQCRRKKVEGSNFCEAHGGNRALQANIKHRINRYKLDQYKSKYGQLDTEHKDLKDEITLMRILIQEFMSLIERDGENGLIMYSGRIADYIAKLEKIVKTCQTIDLQNSKMLDQNQALIFAEQICDLISETVTDITKKINTGTDFKIETESALKLTQLIEHELVDKLIERIIERLAENNGTADSQ